jgi:hypothetical protein
MSNEGEQLLDEVEFGTDVVKFLQSRIGQYLLDRSKEEVDRAVNELKVVNPVDIQQIRSLQNIIKRNEDIEQWLGDVVQAGIEASNMLAGTEN